MIDMMKRQLLAVGAVCALTAMAFAVQGEHAQPPEGGGGQAIHFDHKAGNEWWVEVSLAGFFKDDIDKVSARDDGGAWVPLTLRSWGAWAGSFHIEPGHRVQFRAVWMSSDGQSENLAWTSCSFTHPAGVEQCPPAQLPPEMLSSTYVTIGQNAPSERVNDIALDAAGNAYVIGDRYTSYADHWTQDVFVRQVKADGSYGWLTMLGGSNQDQGDAIAVDAAGNVYVSVTTSSFDLPSDGWQNSRSGSRDAWVAKLSPTGQRLWSTFVGGNDTEFRTDIGVTSDGLPIVVGTTFSCNFPTYGQGFQLAAPSCAPGTFNAHGFVTKLTANGQGAVYSTYLAGTGEDRVHGVSVSPATGSAWLTGETRSTDFPVTAGAAQPTLRGGADAFLTKLDPFGRLEASTYYGGSAFDAGHAVARDAAGNPYITGETMSTDLPTTAGAADRSYATGLQCSGYSGGPRPQWFEAECPDAFVVKGNANATAFSYATYLGTDRIEYGYGIAADDSGRAYVTGRTNATNWPLVGGRAGPGGGYFDSFVHVLSADGATVLHSTPLGGTDGDFGESVAVMPDGTASYAGWTWSLEFPVTANAGQKQREGGEDGFVTRFAAPGGGGSPPPPGTVTFDHKGGNEWWVEAKITGATPAQVQAMDANSPWTAMTLRSWGNWATSFHIEPGNQVKFRAMVDGAWKESCLFTHPAGKTPAGGETCTGSGVVTPPPPPPGTWYNESFWGMKGNQWWAEIRVDSPVTLVEARHSGGDWQKLTKREWGAWAGSFHIPAGSLVQFRAHRTDGAIGYHTQGFPWPDGTPPYPGWANAGSAFDAAFHNVKGNADYQQVNVYATWNLDGVEVRIDDGTWHAMERKAWGDWGAGIHINPGDRVQFRAIGGGGQEASQPIAWPPV